MKKVLIVTGSSRGIGAEIAITASKSNYAVVINYAYSKDISEKIISQIKSIGGEGIAVNADMSKENDIINLFKTTQDHFGCIDALVNNAGITGGVSLIEDITSKQLEEVFKINVAGYFLCSREAIKKMSKNNGGKGGVIINISSVAAKIANPFTWVHYAASKGAIDTFTTGLAMECADLGIRVNAIRPGMVDTELHPEGRINKISPSIPLKRAGTTKEIAEAVVWLLSDKASYIHGAFLDVSGGR